MLVWLNYVNPLRPWRIWLEVAVLGRETSHEEDHIVRLFPQQLEAPSPHLTVVLLVHRHLGRRTHETPRDVRQ